MASDNILGSVQIVITGDTSRLAADFARGQGMASAAGSAIASSLNASLAPGLKASSGLVDQFGRSIQTTAAAASPALVNMAAAGDKLAASLLRVAGAEEVAAAGAKKLGAAHGAAVSEIQATSGALRVLEGSGGIRAAERFLTLIPGVAAAAQFAFPVIGAIALGSAINRIAEESIGLKDRLDELKAATEETDAAFAHLTSTVDQVNIERQTRDFGKTSGLNLQGKIVKQDLEVALNEAKSYYTQRANLAKEFDANNGVNPAVLLPHYGDEILRSQKAQLDALQQKGQKAEADASALEAKLQKIHEDAGKSEIEDSQRVQLARIQNQQQAAEAEISLAEQLAELQVLQVHAVQQARINAMHDTQAAAVASAEEELRTAQDRESRITAILEKELPKRIGIIQAKGAADALGKTPDQQRVIGEQTAGSVEQAKAQAAEKVLQLQTQTASRQFALDEAIATHGRQVTLRLADDWASAFDAITRSAKETADAVSRATDKQITETARVQEIEDKGAGDLKALSIQHEKLEAERQYGQEISHTLQQRLDYLQRIASLEDEERQAKIDGLKTELATAEALSGELRDQTRIAELKREIADLEGKSKNAGYAAQTNIGDVARRQSIRGELGANLHSIGERAPGQLGGALANGVIGGQIGKEVKSALSGIGKDLLGTVLTAAIKELVVKLGINTAAQAALTAITGVHAGATTASTVATTANTGGLLVHAGVLIANTFATAANTIATIWNTIVEVAKSFFGFADGGRPPVGVASIVGEKGPELFLPDSAGTIIPAGKFGSSGGGGLAAVATAGSGGSGGDIHFHGEMNFHGVQNVRQLMREISTISKNASPGHSPGNR